MPPVLETRHPEAILRVLGRAADTVLLIGPGAGDAERPWTATGARVTSLRDTAGFDDQSGPWDVVLFDGALERERWDRWLLQRVHRRLRPRGILVVRAAHLFDLWTLEGLAYLASRVIRQLRRRLTRRGALPVADRSAFHGRRYAPGSLATMVRGVAFEVLSVSVEPEGWPRRLVHLLAPLVRRTGSTVELVARRLPSVWGADRAFPEPATMLADFRGRHSSAIAAREEWVQRTGPRTAPRDLDLGDWARRGAVVFSPHPDDEVIGAGGTLLDLVAMGGAVTLVQVTDGSDSAAFIDEPEVVRRQVRLEEAERVSAMLGARALICLRADNRSLRPTAELRAGFCRVLEDARPGIVLVPSFADIHPDHQVVLRLLADALRDSTAPAPDIALYEVWSLVAPTHVHDVTPRITKIEQMLLTYETALKIDDYVHLVAQRLLFNSLEHRGRAGYLEGFEVLPAARFLELAAGHFRDPGGRP